MAKKERKSHTAAEFDLDVLSGDDDMFRWFLLCYLFGKPIRSETAVATWRLFIDKKLDTPWAITDMSEHALARLLHAGGYSRYEHVIREVGRRITQHLAGNGETVELDLSYEVIGGGENWQMIRELGKDGRVGAMMNGLDAYVSVQELPNEKWRYTLGRRSEFIPFDIPSLLDKLNAGEQNSEDQWGGSDIIAGSPRVGSSKLTPREVEQIINS